VHFVPFQSAREFSKSLDQADKGKEATLSRRA